MSSGYLPKNLALLITLRMPWNNSSTLPHCEEGELIRPPSLSLGYIQKCFRLIMASAKSLTVFSVADEQRLVSDEHESSVAFTPQT